MRWLAALFLLAACVPPQASSPLSPSIQADFTQAPVHGVVSVEDVLIAERAPDVLELMTLAAPGTPQDKTLATTWCRASQEMHARGYEGWHPIRYTRFLSTEGEAAHGFVQLFNGETPPGKKNVEKLKDWCTGLTRHKSDDIP